MTNNLLKIWPSMPAVDPISVTAFSYNTPVKTLLPGQSATVSVQIDTDADFVLTKMACGYSKLVIDPEGTPKNVYPFEAQRNALPVLVNIKDSGDSKDWNKNPVFLSSISGTGELPYIMPTPRRIRATSMITFTLENVSDIEIHDLQIMLGGSKCYFPSDQYGTIGSY